MRNLSEVDAARLRRAQQESGEIRGTAPAREPGVQPAGRSPELEEQQEGVYLRGVFWRWHVRRRRDR